MDYIDQTTVDLIYFAFIIIAIVFLLDLFLDFLSGILRKIFKVTNRKYDD